jgi:hypothetical protein
VSGGASKRFRANDLFPEANAGETRNPTLWRSACKLLLCVRRREKESSALKAVKGELHRLDPEQHWTPAALCQRPEFESRGAEFRRPGASWFAAAPLSICRWQLEFDAPGRARADLDRRFSQHKIWPLASKGFGKQAVNGSP